MTSVFMMYIYITYIHHEYRGHINIQKIILKLKKLKRGFCAARCTQPYGDLSQYYMEQFCLKQQNPDKYQSLRNCLGQLHYNRK